MCAFVDFEVELGVEILEVELKFLSFLIILCLQFRFSDICLGIVKCLFHRILLIALVGAENIHAVI